MPYLFCRATGAERDHLLELRDVFGPVWYIPPQQVGAVDQYRRDVERAFSENRAAWQRNARLFHCQFRRGQIVRLKRDGLDLFMGKFRAVSDDGRYEVDAEMFGRTVLVRAEPHAVMG
jgi:transcription antitermination factor NusG